MNEETYERPARATWTKGQTLEERFWSRVEPADGDKCRLWLASCRENGYGMINWEGKTLSAHVVAFTLTHGPVPPKHVVRHTCAGRYAAGDMTYRRCCHEDHLIDGTRKQNSEDMVADERQAKGERHGSHTRPLSVRKGERHHAAWITAEQVDDLRKRYPVGTHVPYTALAEEYGCSRQTIHNVLHNKYWKEHKNPRAVTSDRHQHGEAHGQAKLTDAVVMEARTRHLVGEPINHLAAEFGVGRSVMRDAIEGITWAHVPGAVAREDRPQTQFRQGSAQPHAVLTEDIVREARRLYTPGPNGEKGMKVKAIARLLDKPYSLLYDAVKGRTWQHVKD